MPQTFYRQPDPNREDWVDFLWWLHGECDYDAADIIHVVEKPHQYDVLYTAYRRAGGLDRGS